MCPNNFDIPLTAAILIKFLNEITAENLRLRKDLQF